MKKISIKSFLEKLNSSSDIELDANQLVNLLPSDFASELAHQILHPQVSSESQEFVEETIEQEYQEDSQENISPRTFSKLPPVPKFEDNSKQGTKENEDPMDISLDVQKEQEPYQEPDTTENKGESQIEISLEVQKEPKKLSQEQEAKGDQMDISFEEKEQSLPQGQEEEEDLMEISFEDPTEQKNKKFSLRKRIKQHQNAILSEKGITPLLPLGDEHNEEVQISLKIKGEGIEFQSLKCLMAAGSRKFRAREYFPNIDLLISSPNIIEADIWISSEKNGVILFYKRRNKFRKESIERVRVALGFLLKIEVLYSEEVESFGKVVRKWIWCRDCDGQLRRFQNY